MDLRLKLAIMTRVGLSQRIAKLTENKNLSMLVRDWDQELVNLWIEHHPQEVIIWSDVFDWVVKNR